MKVIFTVIFLIIAWPNMAMDTGGYFKIAKIHAWAEYTNNTVLVQLEKQHDLCPNGYWFQTANNSSSNLFAIALSAYHAKTPVKIYADEHSDWSGLAAKECKLKLIVLI